MTNMAVEKRHPVDIGNIQMDSTEGGSVSQSLLRRCIQQAFFDLTARPVRELPSIKACCVMKWNSDLQICENVALHVFKS